MGGFKRFQTYLTGDVNGNVRWLRDKQRDTLLFGGRLGVNKTFILKLLTRAETCRIEWTL